jgi:hypothetical protein
VVIVYGDFATFYGYAVVGTVRGDTISFGTPVQYIGAATSIDISIAYDSENNKVVIAYRDIGNSNYGTAIVGTVSGTSISFGTATVFNSSYSRYTSTTYDSVNGKIVIACRDVGNSNYGTAVVGTVSGTSISFGSTVVFESAAVDWISSAFNSAESKIVIAYEDEGNSSYGTVVVGTVSGTSISFGSPVIFESATTQFISTIYDSKNNKIVIGYQDNGNTGRATAIVGTVSGTSISFGSASVFKNANCAYVKGVYHEDSGKVVFFYQNSDSSQRGESVAITVSGTTFTADTSVVITSLRFQRGTASYDTSTKKIVIAYGEELLREEALVYTVAYTGTPYTDFIGITDAAISDTASGSVTIKGGISTNVTGLTAGTDYYVQDDGIIAAAGNLPYDVSGASFDSVSFSVASQDSTPTGVAFNNNGSKMFVVGFSTDAVFEYTLSTGFDISTATFSQSFSVASQETSPTGIAFSPDGTKMFVTGYVGDDMNEYTLTTGFDVSTASFTQNFSIAGEEIFPTGVAFNTDGTKMFISGQGGDDVNEYDLSTGFDLSTASYSQSFSVAAQDDSPYGITFNSDGTKLFVLGTQNDKVYQYSLTTGFDISTASFASDFSITQDTSPTGIDFNNDGTKFFVVGAGSDTVYQYSSSSASTAVLAGKALSSTSINLDYTT